MARDRLTAEAINSAINHLQEALTVEDDHEAFKRVDSAYYWVREALRDASIARR